MSRAERLLSLLQALRRRRRPVAARVLADDLGVSLRTLYRDIGALRAQGADVAGEAGVGYQLKPGYMLPPLMFTLDELDALALGARWVAQNADAALAKAAEDAMAKIAAVAPPDRGEFFEEPTQLVGPAQEPAKGDELLPDIREAMRLERKLALDYVDAKGEETSRIVWPIALGFLGGKRVIAAWCEARADFRHFRVDRILGLKLTNLRLPVRRRVLLREWQATDDVDI